LEDPPTLSRFDGSDSSVMDVFEKRRLGDFSDIPWLSPVVKTISLSVTDMDRPPFIFEFRSFKANHMPMGRMGSLAL